MQGVAGGLIAALTWGVSGLLAARASRALGALASLAVGNAVGFVAFVPLALLLGGNPFDGPPREIVLILLSGVTAMLAFACAFHAYTSTPVGIVAGVIAADGAFAAAFAIAVLGERPSALALTALAVVAVGVVLAALRLEARRLRLGVGVIFAFAASVLFASSLVIGAQIEELSPLWVLAGSRIVGITCITIPFLLLRGVPHVPVAIRPVVAAVPLLDGGGFLAYLAAARGSVAVASVLASMNAVVTALLSASFLRERLNRQQWSGIVVAALGMALLAIARA